MSIRNLDRLFQPRSVALVGASARPGSLGAAVLANLRGGGFRGGIHLINPRHSEIAGIPCAARLSDLPAPPDIVVIAAPRGTVVEIAEEAAALGVPVCIVITADPNHGDESLRTRLKDLAARTDMRVVGPNCLGVLSPRAGLDASFAADRPPPGDLAVISQSGAVTASLLAFAAERRVGFSGLVSIGDMADVDFDDLLDWFAIDPATRAILMYVEAITDSKAFMSAARAAARVKPVIVIKAGRSRSAARAAATHTGALTGADDVYSAAFRRAGVLRVNDIDELFAAAETLGRIAPFKGDRLAIVTNGGGLGVLAVDELAALGGKLATFQPETIEKLDATMPPTWSRANPADIVGDADAARFAAALGPILEDANTDAAMVIHCPTALSQPLEVARAVANAVVEHRRTSFRPRPVFAVWLGHEPGVDEIFEQTSIPHFASSAMRGFMHLVKWRESREALMATPQELPADGAQRETARRIVTDAIARGDRWLDVVDITRVLEAYQIPCAPARLARTPDEAAEIAAPIIAEHGACVVKIFSRDITHKSDVSGVMLDMTTQEGVRKAARQIMERARSARPDAHIEGVTIHPMIRRPNGRELIAGVAEDPTFGPVILFGRGGTAVEVINDKALALPPLDMNLARAQIERTRVARLLRSYRDKPQADIDAVAQTLVRLAQMSADIPEIRGLDLNPLIADEHGVIALDARLEVAPCPASAPGRSNPRFSVAPYPRWQERRVDLKDGAQLFFRPVRPEDDGLYRRFFNRVTAEDMRRRFFTAVKDLDHVFIARLTQIDYARACAIVAIDESDGEMAGGVRVMHDPDQTNGEYAILVRSDFKGRGLGWALMRAAIDYARAAGLKTIHGHVLAENRAMLDMCAALGFSISEDKDDVALKVVTLDVATAFA
ncbi:MAG: GNAT family N-acetyltransferase [Beijerinckiaceae bacterium]